MSRHPVKAPRRDKDFYETPASATRALLDAWDVARTAGGRWLEPSAGHGAIIRAVTDWRREQGLPVPVWSAVEIRRGAERYLQDALAHTEQNGASYHIGDFLKTRATRRYTVGVGNPAFVIGFETLKRTLAICDHVAFLLSAHFFETAERSDWLRENTPDVYELSKRPSFTGEGTDMASYRWCVWGLPEMRRRSVGFYRLLPHPDSTRSA